jgi:hypothetical protein
MSRENQLSPSFFSGSYEKGRRKFLDACKSGQLNVHSYLHPIHKGPQGEDLAIDCTLIGSENAKRVLFVTCGTHGLEGAAGSATLLQFMSGDALAKLPSGLAVLIVHAVNPYGWAYNRRGNEDGIDLNRNFLNHEEPYPQNRDYDELHDLIKDAQPDARGLEEFTNTFHRFARTRGMGAAINGITAGQYEYANGMSFGGHAASWSSDTLLEILNRFLAHARKVILIDWHTGIGDFGQPFFIIDDPAASIEYELAASWWQSHSIHADDVLEGGTPNYSGLLVRGLKNKISSSSGANVVSVVIEWGTYGLDEMLQALLLDDWLKENPSSRSPMTQTARSLLIERFFPAAREWRNSVLSHAGPIYEQALKGLNAW